jgi:hypothetical protein
MRAVDVEPSYAELVEANRKYLVLVTKHHPELAHMVPAEKLIQQEAAKRVRIIKGRAPAAAPPTNYIPPPRKPIEVRAAEVAERHDILVEELIGPSCSRRYSEARGEFIVACRKLDLAYARIGLYMNRNFSTIIHHEKKYLATLRGAA